MAHIYREVDGEEMEIEVEARICGRHIAASMDGPEEWPELEILSVFPDEELTEVEIERVWEQVADLSR